MKTTLFTAITLKVNGADVVVEAPGILTEPAIVAIVHDHGAAKASYSYCVKSRANVLAYGCILPLDMESKP